MSIDVQDWAAGLDELGVRVGHRFGRVEPRRQAMTYVRGLLAGLERKNGWTLAEFAGDTSPDAMQRLLRRARWDADMLRDDLRDYVVEHLGDRDAVLIVDETGFIKKGVRSAGVQRQYSGTAGRTENCQIGTFLAYASRHGRALIDRELYMPASWLADRERCRKAAVPDQVEFATKPAQAQMMIARAIAADVPFAWVTADEAYGQATYLRHWLEDLNVFHVLAVRCTDPVTNPVTTADGPATVKALVAALPAHAWRRRSAGAGAHGERLYDWARIGLAAPAAGRGRWVLARRRICDGEIAYYLCYGPAATHSTSSSPSRRPGGRSRSASRQPKVRPGSTTTRSAATRPGPATSPCPCSPTPTWPPPPQPAETPTQTPTGTRTEPRQLKGDPPPVDNQQRPAANMS